MAKGPTKEELSKLDYTPPATEWMDTPVEFKPGTFCWGAKGKNLQDIGFSERTRLVTGRRQLEAAERLGRDGPRGDG